MRFTAALLASFLSVVGARAEQIVDDFSTGPLDLQLLPDVTYVEVTQSIPFEPPVLDGRVWDRVWSGVSPGDPPVIFSVDTDAGVFRVETPNDPFTYFGLSYRLYGGFQFSQPIPLDATAAGYDRVRLRFEGETAGVYLSVELEAEADSGTRTERVLLGNRTTTTPGGVLDIPFSDLSDDPEFFESLTGLRFWGSRYQQEFELASISFAGAPLAGDLNRDGAVDGQDLDYLHDAYAGIRERGEPVSESQTNYHTADVNGDGQINAGDYVAWRDAVDAPLAVSTPEPTTAAIVVAAMMTLVVAPRR